MATHLDTITEELGAVIAGAGKALAMFSEADQCVQRSRQRKGPGMSKPITVYRDRADPVTANTVEDLDELLDHIDADPAYRRFPVMVSLETADREQVLEILLGRPDLSLLVWHHVFVDLVCSKGTRDQPAGLAYNFGGSRTDAYDRSAITVEAARQAARQFFATRTRPSCVDWQEPRYAEQDESV